MLSDIEKSDRQIAAEIEKESEELKSLGIEEEEIENKISELRAERRSLIYIRNQLRNWIGRAKEEEIIKEIAVKNHPLEYFINELSKTIKYDRVTEICNMATAISALTRDPLNSYLRGPSSIGKTYTVIETVKYFPEEDVWNLGGMSPTALVHERGIWIDSEGREIRPEDKPVKPRREDYESKEEFEEAKTEYELKRTEWNRRLKGASKLVDISHKVLVFLEAPHPDTLNKLKMILSHDREAIMFKIADKNLKGQLETITTIVKGFPSVFVCSVRKQNEEIISRFFTYTPEMREEKYRAALELINKRFSEKWNFNKESREQTNLKIYIRALKRKLIEEGADIVIPFNTVELFPTPKNMDMRFYKYFLEMAQAFTVLNLFKRIEVEMEDKKYYLASAEDIALAYIVYRKIKETTETGEQQDILDFYHEYLEAPSEYTLEQLYNLWKTTTKTKLMSKESFRQKVVNVLVNIGYLEKYENPENRNYNLYRPVQISYKEERERALDNIISNIEVLVKPKLENSVREWLSNNLKKISSINNKKVPPLKGEKREKIIEWFVKKLMYIDEKILRLFDTEEEVSNEPAEEEDSIISEIRVSQVEKNSSKSNEEEPEIELFDDEPKEDTNQDEDEFMDNKPNPEAEEYSEFAEQYQELNGEELNGGTKEEDRITKLRMKYEGWNYGDDEE